MNARLTPGLLAIALVLAALVGPLTELKQVGDKPDLITDAVFWRGVGASAIGSFATSALTLIALLSTTLGLPALFARWGAGQPGLNEPGGGSSAPRTDTPPPGG